MEISSSIEVVELATKVTKDGCYVSSLLWPVAVATSLGPGVDLNCEMKTHFS